MGKREQDVCADRFHGLSAGLYLQLSAHGGPAGVMTLLRRLRLLGTDPAGWTRRPLG